MDSGRKYFYRYELDQTKLPDFFNRIIQVEQTGATHTSRTYPGYPNWPLEKVKPRLWSHLEKTLLHRRSVRQFEREMLPRSILSRLLFFGHGISGNISRGTIPSSGDLQALELYLVIFESSWINQGLYHYDRAGHYLSEIAKQADRNYWKDLIPSMVHFEGGALLWVLVGDGARITEKYGERGYRFLLLEAGHLMQNLCLLSSEAKLCTLPLGGFLEESIAKEFHLPASDVVLYVGACGKIKK